MAPILIAILLSGGALGPAIVSHDVIYCASIDSYRFDIRIDGEWDFGTIDGEGRRATGLVYLLGEEAGFWTRRVEVVGTHVPFQAEIRMGDSAGGALIATAPIRSFDAGAGWLQFTLPTWTFGVASRDLVYTVLVTTYGDGTPVMGWTYRSSTCVPVAAETVTWGYVKAVYR